MPKRLRERYSDKIKAWQDPNNRWHICYLLIKLAETYGVDHSLAEFADFVRFHPSTLSRWFHEREARFPRRHQILDIARYIAINPSVETLTRRQINQLLAAIGETGIQDNELGLSLADEAMYSADPLDEIAVKSLLDLLNDIPLDGRPQVVTVENLRQAGAATNLDLIIDGILDLSISGFIQRTEIDGGEAIVVHRHLTPQEMDLVVTQLIQAKQPIEQQHIEVFRTGISGLDYLLSGGLKIPHRQGLTVVLEGPPGAGKSTLALLLAVAWARQGGHSLYCALEQAPGGLEHTARAFDYYSPSAYEGWVWLSGRRAGRQWPSKRGAVKVTGLMSPRTTFDARLQELEQHVKKMRSDLRGLVVIDSLNVLTELQLYRSQVVRLKKLLDRRAIITILILEATASTSSRDGMEEFVADVVIELNTAFDQGYLLRTIEIKKSRYQFHALGRHIIKIHSPEATGPEHPTGIVVFPSVHFHLSMAKKETAAQTELKYLKTGIPSLDRLLGGQGLMARSATALVGPVGSRKTAIALSFLAQGAQEGEQVVLFSLASEPEAVRLFPIFTGDQRFDWDEPASSRRFQVKSFRPGFITPEEFVDQILRTLRADRGSQGVTRVVFDGVSHLPLRFPLLAASYILLPTLLDIFKAYGITSVFIGVTGEGENDALNQGLIVMADNAFALSRNHGTNLTQFQIMKLAGQYADHHPRLLRDDENGRIVVTEVGEVLKLTEVAVQTMRATGRLRVPPDDYGE